MAEEENIEEFYLMLSGNGVDIKRTISAPKAALVMSVVMGMDALRTEADLNYSQPNGTSQPNSTSGPIKISLREFLDSVKASKKPDQIVAIGQYMGIHEGHATFTRDHIKARFSAAREPLPGNFPRDFGAAIKAGTIAQDHKKAGHYYVTKTGIQAIERNFGSLNKK